jgi:formylglycine-generating enzyme required for sulfatase activity
MRSIKTLFCLGSFSALLASITASGQPIAAKKPPDGMVRIAGTTFQMGQDASDIPRLQEMFKVKRTEMFTDETPKHRVKLDPFYLDRTEVTNAAFKKFVDKLPEWQKGSIAAAFHNGKYLQDWNGTDFPAGKARHPVVFVSWYAAVAYCQAQGKRLPTEAEWEFATAGGLKSKAFPWGDEMPGPLRANFSASGLKAATEVASYPANGYGLFDMAGNVWEYLADEWQKYPETEAVQINPVAGGDLFPGNSFRQIKTRRSIRGGSFGAAPINMRVTFRDSHLPENAGDHVGFRCAMGADK